MHLICILWFYLLLYKNLFQCSTDRKTNQSLYTPCGKHLHDSIILLRGKAGAHFLWSACTKPGKWVAMYLCVRGIDYDPFYHVAFWFWDCFDSGFLGVFFHINNFLFAKSWRLFKKENQILSLTSVPRI